MANRCTSICKSGTRCKMTVVPETMFCQRHKPCVEEENEEIEILPMPPPSKKRTIEHTIVSDDMMQIIADMTKQLKQITLALKKESKEKKPYVVTYKRAVVKAKYMVYNLHKKDAHYHGLDYRQIKVQTDAIFDSYTEEQKETWIQNATTEMNSKLAK